MLLCKDRAKKFLRLILMLPTLLPLSACALSGGPVVGQVLEEGTYKPVPGAIVVVRWIGRTTSGSWFVEARDVCYHVETVVTDEQGQYKTAAWTQEQSKDYTLKYHSFSVDAYKPGFGWPTKPSQNNDIVYLATFKGGTRERLDYLGRVISGTSCGGAAGESLKYLYRLTRAVYEEARTVAQTADEKRRAERFRELAEDTLVNRSKSTRYDERGRLINVNPEDSFKPEELK